MGLRNLRPLPQTKLKRLTLTLQIRPQRLGVHRPTLPRGVLIRIMDVRDHSQTTPLNHLQFLPRSRVHQKQIWRNEEQIPNPPHHPLHSLPRTLKTYEHLHYPEQVYRRQSHHQPSQILNLHQKYQNETRINCWNPCTYFLRQKHQRRITSLDRTQTWFHPHGCHGLRNGRLQPSMHLQYQKPRSCKVRLRSIERSQPNFPSPNSRSSLLQGKSVRLGCQMERDSRQRRW